LENKRVEQVLHGSRGGGGGGDRGEVAYIMYTHTSKCKNDNTKLKLKKAKLLR
jgi:hypothetical protein